MGHEDLYATCDALRAALDAAEKERDEEAETAAVLRARLDAARALAAETVEALERADHRIGCSLTIVYDGIETVPCDCGLHSLAAKWRDWSGPE